MSDEPEKLKIRLHRDHFVAVKWSELLAALRDAGFEIYRPDECHPIVIDNEIGVERGPWRMVVDWNVGEAYLETDLADGHYRLVPVGGED